MDVMDDFFANKSGADFSYIFSRENFGENSAENPQKCWEKLKFSAEKVSKNHFSKKFHGNKCTKN
jgi:hypothetical protein